MNQKRRATSLTSHQFTVHNHFRVENKRAFERIMGSIRKNKGIEFLGGIICQGLLVYYLKVNYKVAV